MVRLDRRDEGGFFVSIVEALGPARQAERLLGRKQARLVEAENTIRVDAIENVLGEMRRARQHDPPVGFRDFGANNSMFSRALCLSDGAPFEESLNEIGGEDSLLLERLTMRGLRFAWAARAIKAIDPTAQVFGPSSWGATEMVNFQNAPDWRAHARYGSFLALYLDAFRKASEQDGKHLLDTLDVHWYPFTSRGKLFRTDAEALDVIRLDAPRSLTESGFVEDSWVARALSSAAADRLGLPILPSLRRIIARRFPGTKLSISEFNYGLGKRIPSALALADALGCYATGGVYLATHWGSLADLLSESYRLYRAPDVLGGGFSGHTVSIRQSAADTLSAFAADDGSALRLVLINRAPREIAVEFGAPRRRFRQTHGFEADRSTFGERTETPRENDGAVRFALPAYSARRYLFV